MRLNLPGLSETFIWKWQKYNTKSSWSSSHHYFQTFKLGSLVCLGFFSGFFPPSHEKHTSTYTAVISCAPQQAGNWYCLLKWQWAIIFSGNHSFPQIISSIHGFPIFFCSREPCLLINITYIYILYWIYYIQCIYIYIYNIPYILWERD